MTTKSNKILYDALLRDNRIAKEQLELAMEEADKSAQPIANILIERKLISEKELLEILGKELQISCINIKDISVDKSIIYKVPLKIASHYNFLPIKIENGVLTIAVSSPLDIKAQDEIRTHVGYDIDMVFSCRDDIGDMIRHYYGLGAEAIQKITAKPEGIQKGEVKPSEEKIEDISRTTEEMSVINLVNQIIVDAYRKRASDIHLESYREKVRLRYRIDGILYNAPVPSEMKALYNAILSRIKIISNLNIVEHRLPQDGRAIVNIQDQTLDLRISIIPTPHGECLVIRILPTKMLFSLKELGLREKIYEIFEDLINIPHGIIFITGPTGSGKTTTLYACLSMINKEDRKIITIEDPIEYELEGITQIQVTPEIGLTFAHGLRSVLRHDPDVIMVGEVRDLETAEISIRTALTGHLVFSTLHTNDAPSGITRLIDIGVEPYLIASSVEAFIAQRLIRRICPSCKAEDTDIPKEIKIQIAEDLNIRSPDAIKVYKGKGCTKCNKSGFYGRIAIYEILLLDSAIRELILKRISSSQIKDIAIHGGMRTLRQDGWQRVVDGLTTPGEVMDVSPADEHTGGAAEYETVKAVEIETEKPVKIVNNPQSVPGLKDLQEERRTYMRLDTKVNIMYKLVDSKRGMLRKMPPSGQFSTTENISAGGLLLVSREPLPIGGFVELKIELPDAKGPIMCLGRVLRVENRKIDNNYNLAICFIDLSSAERARIDRYVVEELRL